jgi:3-oxoacyl-[acyl-carrier protein] reductase
VTGVSRGEGIGAAIARRLAAGGAGVFTQGWQAHDAAQPWGAGAAPKSPEAAQPWGRSAAPGAPEVAQPWGRGAAPGAPEVAQPWGPGPAPGAEGLAGHLEADLADPAAPAALLAAARIALGHVDVLVANHAASVGGTLEELTAEAIDHALAVNVRATLLLVQAFAAGFERGHGRVVLLTSGQGRGPMAGELPYAASKAALSGVVLSLSDHLAPRGITVNAVNPGPTDTGWAGDDVRSRVEAAMPRGRWGTPDDAARLVAWLASEESEWVTGQVIDSDGGFRYGGA